MPDIILNGSELIVRYVGGSHIDPKTKKLMVVLLNDPRKILMEFLLLEEMFSAMKQNATEKIL